MDGGAAAAVPAAAAPPHLIPLADVQVIEGPEGLSGRGARRESGDRVGAAHMLAVRPPGSGTDLAPTWLVD